MALTQEQADWFAESFEKIVDNIDVALVGKRHQVRLLLAAFLAGGHVLIEDNPGTGKTLLATALAKSVAASTSRIQFHPALTAGDIIGVTTWSAKDNSFSFHAGPVFANIVVADQIDHGTPNALSALLEVMESGIVTVDSIARSAGDPFSVVATRNPPAWTSTLAVEQLDRFMFAFSLGHPDDQMAVDLILDAANAARVTKVQPIFSAQTAKDLRALCDPLYIDPAVAAYINDLVKATHAIPGVEVGVSMRAALSLARVAKVWAAARGRTWLHPDDVAELAVPAFAHRLVLGEAEADGVTAAELIERMLLTVPKPAPPFDGA